jgi:hypothetical protein
MAKIKINKKKNEARISLNKTLYPEEAIKTAAAAFRPIGNVKLGEEVIISPKEKEANLKEIALGFCDYVLGLIGNQEF